MERRSEVLASSLAASHRVELDNTCCLRRAKQAQRRNARHGDGIVDVGLTDLS